MSAVCRNPPPALTLRTVAPAEDPVSSRAKVTVALSPLEHQDTSGRHDGWVIGPDCTFYPPPSAIAYQNWTHHCAPFNMYALHHEFRGLVHVHVYPWIPRPMACSVDRRDRVCSAGLPVVSVDQVSLWRLLFERCYTYDALDRCGLWAGSKMDIAIIERDDTGLPPVSLPPPFPPPFLLSCSLALLLSPQPLTPHALHTQVTMRSPGTRMFLSDVNEHLWKMLCTLAPGFDPDDLGRDPLLLLDKDILNDYIKQLTNGFFQVFRTERDAIECSPAACPVCLTETAPFWFGASNDWPHAWFVFMTSIDDREPRPLCTFCKMDYLHLADQQHWDTLEGICLLGNRALAPHSDGDVPWYLCRVPREIWGAIGAQEKKRVRGGHAHEPVFGEAVWRRGAGGDIERIDADEGYAKRDRRWIYRRRTTKWLHVTRHPTCTHDSTVTVCYRVE